METAYFIIVDKEKKGPFSAKEITLLNLNNETPIWYSELTDWTTFGELRKLHQEFGTTPPPYKNAKNNNMTNSMNPILKIGIYTLISIFGILIISNYYDNSRNSNNNNKSDSSSEINQEDLESEKLKQLTIKNKNYRNNWAEYIIATRSSFNYNDFGGIYNLSIYLVNKSEYSLNQVQVAVDYIKSAGGIYKTEFITFENVKPESKMILNAPNSDRGTKIEYRICNIYAPSFHFCFD